MTTQRTEKNNMRHGLGRMHGCDLMRSTEMKKTELPCCILSSMYYIGNTEKKQNHLPLMGDLNESTDS